MSPKRGDRAAPPPIGHEYDLRFANTDAADGWENLCRHAAGNLRRAFEKIRSNPRARDNPARQHRLLGNLGTGVVKGQALECWQFEVTGSGRIWYLVDDTNRVVWITHASTRHPKATD